MGYSFVFLCPEVDDQLPGFSISTRQCDANNVSVKSAHLDPERGLAHHLILLNFTLFGGSTRVGLGLGFGLGFG